MALALVLIGVAGIVDPSLGGPTLFWPAAYARLATGLGLLVTALLIFAAQAGRLQAAQDIVLAATLGVLGLAVTLGPWLVRLVSDLGQERAARVRSQERADVATLARAQERDLRAWMYGDAESADLTVTAALRIVAAELEDSHGVPVELVVVGDAGREVPVTDDVRALVQAAREAMVNAAQHAGAPVVDVYAEVGRAAVDVFVRDRGVGFEEAAVAADRLGVRHSIRERMERHGGRADIRSAPGAGTEVALHLDLADGTP